MSYVHYYDYQRVRAEDNFTDFHPLARRMSPLQKAGLMAWHHFTQNRKDLFAALISDATVPFFYATSFGETRAIFDVAGSVIRKELPVSPVSFQHSVENAAAGYVTIIHKLNNAGITLPNGFFALDKGLFFADKLLKANIYASLILMFANEFPFDGKGTAEVELIVLGANKEGQNHFKLSLIETIEHTPPPSAEFTRDAWKRDAQKPESLYFPLMKLSSKLNSFERCVQDESGHGYLSKWELT